METLDCTIRKVTGLDFGPVRQLPVQLCQHSAAALQLKQLRMMMQVSDHDLLLLECDERIAGFMALQHIKPFLLIKYLAIDRLARQLETVVQLEQHATDRANQLGCVALIVKASQLTGTSLGFFHDLGYRLDGHTLIKAL